MTILSSIFGSLRNSRRSRRCGHNSPRQLSIECLETRSLLTALTWSPGVDLPTPRAQAAAVEVGGAVMVAGGGTTTVNFISPNSTAWTTGAPLDIARVSPGLAPSDIGLYLAYGGQVGNTAIPEALTYTPFNVDLVQDAAGMNPARTAFGYAADGSLRDLAIGGLDDQNRPLSSVTAYSASTNSWQALASLPVSLYGEAAVNDGAGHILTFGGIENGSTTANVHRYNVSSNTWDTVAPMLVAERDGAAVLASDGRIYVLGGTDSGTVLSTVQSYDPTTDTWKMETNLPQPLSSLAAASDSAGHIIVIGGFDQNHSPVASVSVSQVLNAPDVAPSFVSTAAASVAVGSNYAYQAIATANPQAVYSLVNSPAGMTIDPWTGIVDWVPTVAQAGPNSVTVKATNVVGAVTQTFSVRALTPAPTTPTGLTVTSTTISSISLAWAPSADSIGVTGYRVYRIGHTGFHGITTTYTQVADVTGTTATISGLPSGTSYQYVVTAYNASGNVSTRSTAVSATTQSPINYYGPTTVNAVALHPVSFTLSATAVPNTFTFTALDPASGMTVDANTGLVVCQH